MPSRAYIEAVRPLYQSGMTWDEILKRVGGSRPTLASAIRIIKNESGAVRPQTQTKPAEEPSPKEEKKAVKSKLVFTKDVSLKPKVADTVEFWLEKVFEGLDLPKIHDLFLSVPASAGSFARAERLQGWERKATSTNLAFMQKKVDAGHYSILMRIFKSNTAKVIVGASESGGLDDNGLLDCYARLYKEISPVVGDFSTDQVEIHEFHLNNDKFIASASTCPFKEITFSTFSGAFLRIYRKHGAIRTEVGGASRDALSLAMVFGGGVNAQQLIFQLTRAVSQMVSEAQVQKEYFRQFSEFAEKMGFKFDESALKKKDVTPAEVVMRIMPIEKKESQVNPSDSPS